MVTKGSSTDSESMRILPKLDFSLRADQILSLTRLVIESSTKELDRIGSLRPEECTFVKAIWPLAKLETEVNTKLSTATFLQYVSPNEEIRQASVEATKILDNHLIEKVMRDDLFRVTRCVAENKEEMSILDNESKRLVEKMMLSFKHNGLFLSPTAREILKEKRKRLAELAVEFSKNMNEDKTQLLFSAEELDGCSEDFLAGLERAPDGRFVITTKYPDVFGVLKRAHREDVRKRMDVAFNGRCRENDVLLEEAIRLRLECAQLLGYRNHAEFQLEDRLAKSPTAVWKFEADLQNKLTSMAQRELAKLRDLKKQEKQAKGQVIEEKDIFGSWDYHYYSRILLERDYALDDEKIKEFYSLESVIKEMLHIYEQVLGLQFIHLTDTPTWHEDVRLYEVRNANSDDNDAQAELVGHIYLDLFPRPGKYTHAACFNIQSGAWMDPKKTMRQYPAAAMVANFSKPTPGKPSLLKHDEVVTLFHELGHAMHDMCAYTTYGRFHGTSVETDFVEAPSQMLENWCWDGEMLRRIGKHYLRSNETFSDEQIRQMVRAKNFNAGLLNLRQVFFGLFDMTIHSIEQVDLKEALNGETINQLYGRLRSQITLISQPEGVCPAASFGHMMGGYDAGYYGYLWSQVFSADMFYSRFRREGLLNRTTGLEYRQKVLKPGGSREGMKSLVDFLGREPTSDAFMKSLGLNEVENDDGFLEL